ncbi:DUF2267 domain-containing protein [Actinopolymorpha rutila]|uniref:Uncharacterized protein (DUF2267 family) n=1 Tax=Actinopolymorpha rutila TaxID=446787 RepID=A0A852ZN64_9ACTN|nr:DUF2267 domain-containing protein [Actinopolymorpha rutila]NYH90909.1 uncharacterized protein (DUF2267 family) [Actinopolymorpha rutila]
MDYDQFLTIVERGGGATGVGADRSTAATLQTLAERISPTEARHLAGELPPELGPLLFTAEPAEGFDVDEFIRRVAERGDMDLPTATRAASAVFTALSRALSEREFAHLVAQLPKDFVLVLPTGPEILPAGAFLERVAQRAQLHDGDASRVTDAVLQTLAERIAAGEVDDLISRLPSPLHDPLRAGRSVDADQAQRMSVERFLARVAEREGVTPQEAFVHARAVMTTLREAVGEEFHDVVAQLGPKYAALWSG